MKKQLNSINYSKAFLICFFVFLSQFISAQDFKILVFHKTNGFRHSGAINGANDMLEELGTNSNHDTWEVDNTNDSSVFTTENLSQYDVVVFNNTTGGGLLNDNQQAAMEQFIQDGNGYIGFHSATDTYRNTNEDSSWPWYNELVGAIVQSSPNHSANNLEGTMNLLIDHPVTSHIGNIGDTWVHNEEWYYWERNGGQLSDDNIVLLEVQSTGNESFDTRRPITWLKEYDGGRSFYTALGHNGSTYESNETFRTMIEQAVLWVSNRLEPSEEVIEEEEEEEFDCATLTSEWSDLLENDLECWEIWMGVPHTSTGLPGSSNSVTNGSGTPLGLNNDPTNVYSIIEENGEKQLYITGEVYGGLTTLNEYSNYHLSMEFKWGEQKWEPRLNLLRDSGILYHCNGEHGRFWDVWQSSLEFQVQETDLGDYIGLAGARGLVPSENNNGLMFLPRGELNTNATISAGSNPEFPNGEWNLLEVIVIGDRAIHYVNGVMVNALRDATWNGDTLTRGQIQIQSEGAELYYRDIKIKSETNFPEEDLETLGWNDSETITIATDVCDEEEAPIGETIALRKAGGDQRWVTIEPSTSNLIANGDEDDRELFLVEEHPNGCVALKSMSTDKYIQVDGDNTDTEIRANGDAPGTWEDFGWEQIGNSQVALQSSFNNGWIQANWRQDNASLFPRGQASGDWETFDFEIINTETLIDTPIINIEEPEEEETEESTDDTVTVVHITKSNAIDFAIDGNHGADDEQNIYLWSENENNQNQQWIEIDRGDGYYSYQKMGTDHCIDGDNGGANGQNVYLYTCNLNNFNQHWEKVSTGNGTFQLVKRNAPGYAIDGGIGGTNRQNVGLWDSSNTSQNLQWFITPIENVSAKSLDFINTENVIIYPNPLQSTTTIDGASNSTIRIYDINGKILFTKNISSESETIDLSSLQSGLYYAQIHTLSQVHFEKIIKN